MCLFVSEEVGEEGVVRGVLRKRRDGEMSGVMQKGLQEQNGGPLGGTWKRAAVTKGRHRRILRLEVGQWGRAGGRTGKEG